MTLSEIIERHKEASEAYNPLRMSDMSETTIAAHQDRAALIEMLRDVTHERDAALEALKPFAAMYEKISPPPDDLTKWELERVSDQKAAFDFTWADLRRAAMVGKK